MILKNQQYKILYNNSFKIAFLIFCLLILKSHSKQKKSVEELRDQILFKVQELDDYNFELFVNSGLDNPWFLIFHDEFCPHCKKVKELIDKLTSTNNLDTNIHESDYLGDSKTIIGLIDCNKNMLICFRFNITRVPYMIKINENFMYEYMEFPSIENFRNFILKKNNHSDKGLMIPEAINYFDYFIKSLEKFIKSLNKFNSNVSKRFLLNNKKLNSLNIILYE